MNSPGSGRIDCAFDRAGLSVRGGPGVPGDGTPVRVRLVLFDLDGTLVDTAPDLTRAVNRMLAQLTLPPVAQSDVCRWVGDGVRVLVSRALGGGREAGSASAPEERGIDLFWRAYGREICVDSRPYAGVTPTLTGLRARGFKLACVTNKPRSLALSLLEAVALRRHFDLVVGGDSLALKKPDPAPLVFACNELGVSPAETVMVGDSANDVRAARAAGTAVICVSYGYNQDVDLATLGPDRVIDSFAQLAELVEQPR